MRNLGGMGEAIFKKWCDEVGLIANKSTDDMYGWDYIVEFPASKPESPSDLHKSDFECKVQVKASDKKKRRIDISLSNAYRLATSPIPSFIIVVEFDDTHKEKRAFLIHIERKFISQTLKRVHKLNQDEQFDRMHKKTISVSYGYEDMLSGMSGESIKNRLLDHIGIDFDQYLVDKKKILESSGYEHGRYRVTFKVDSEEQIQSLVDASLGLKKEVQVSRFLGVHTRFGIDSKKPFIDSYSGTLQLSPTKPAYVGRIRFKETKTEPWLSFCVNIYNSNINDCLPEHLRRIRIEGEFFDIFMNHSMDKLDFKLKVDHQVRFQIEKLYNIYKLFNILSGESSEVMVELDLEGLKKINFSVGDSSIKGEFSHELTLIDDAKFLIERFSILDQIQVSLDDLLRFENQTKLLRESLGLSTHYLTFQFSDGVEKEFLDELEKSQDVVVMSILWTVIGGYRLLAILGYFVNFEEVKDDSVLFASDRVSVDQLFVIESGEAIPAREILDVYNQLEDEYDQGHFVVNNLDKDSLLKLGSDQGSK